MYTTLDIVRAKAIMADPELKKDERLKAWANKVLEWEHQIKHGTKQIKHGTKGYK